MGNNLILFCSGCGAVGGAAYTVPLIVGVSCLVFAGALIWRELTR